MTMTKGEARRARKDARAKGRALVGELRLDRGREPEEFTESTAGYRARERWARAYNARNGAPEGEADR
jgi:hypothetical protein